MSLISSIVNEPHSLTVQNENRSLRHRVEVESSYSDGSVDAHAYLTPRDPGEAESLCAPLFSCCYQSLVSSPGPHIASH